MMNTNTTKVINAALASVSLRTEEVEKVTINLENGLYELTVLTDFQKYDFYVDAETLEVLGINAEPTLEGAAESYDEYAKVSTRIAA